MILRLHHMVRQNKHQSYLVLIINIWNAKSLNIVHNGIETFSKVKYLGFILDGSLSGESMALNVIEFKVSTYIDKSVLYRHLYTSLIQPLFDYGYTAWFQNFSKILRVRL